MSVHEIFKKKTHFLFQTIPQLFFPYILHFKTADLSLALRHALLCSCIVIASHCPCCSSYVSNFLSFRCLAKGYPAMSVLGPVTNTSISHMFSMLLSFSLHTQKYIFLSQTLSFSSKG